MHIGRVKAKNIDSVTLFADFSKAFDLANKEKMDEILKA